MAVGYGGTGIQPGARIVRREEMGEFAITVGNLFKSG
jgi:hypothetical protein